MRKLLVICLSASALFLAGCFDYDEDLIINADGSGTVSMRYSMEKEFFEQMQSLADMMSGQAGTEDSAVSERDFVPDKSKIVEALVSGGSGAKLVSYEASLTGEEKVWNLKFSFTDINRIDAITAAMSPGISGWTPSAESWTSFRKQDDGTFLFTRSFINEDTEEGYLQDSLQETDEAGEEEFDGYTPEDFEDTMGEEPDIAADTSGEVMEGTAEDFNRMLGKLADHKIKVTVRFPGRVIETNATSTEGSSATWEYSLLELSTSPSQLTAVIEASK